MERTGYDEGRSDEKGIGGEQRGTRRNCKRHQQEGHANGARPQTAELQAKATEL